MFPRVPNLLRGSGFVLGVRDCLCVRGLSRILRLFGLPKLPESPERTASTLNHTIEYHNYDFCRSLL